MTTLKLFRSVLVLGSLLSVAQFSHAQAGELKECGKTVSREAPPVSVPLTVWTEDYVERQARQFVGLDPDAEYTICDGNTYRYPGEKYVVFSWKDNPERNWMATFRPEKR